MGFTIIKPPRKDTFIKQRSTGCKCFGKTLPVGRMGNKVFRSLIEFDLSRLPPFFKIVNATLHLYLAPNSFPNISNTVDIHQILSPWPEKRISFKHQPLFKQFPSSSVKLTKQHTKLVSFDLTSLIENWYQGTEANLGILLKMANECIRGETVFASKEFPNSEYWPYLKIEYLDPVSADKPCPQTIENLRNVTTHNEANATDPLNTLLFNYTYIVVNTGSAPAIAHFQLSPDGHHWETNGPDKIIYPGEQQDFVADYIKKYSRLCYKSACFDQSTTLRIYIQGYV